MSAEFIARLHTYYSNIGHIIKGEADASAIFPNKTDNGMSREAVYKQCLVDHLPSCCDVFLGGFIFDQKGTESKQVDIIVTTDKVPRFKLSNSGKSFSCVEGTLACVSSKATLDKEQLLDSLANFAAIPATLPLEGRTLPGITISDYDDWPYKVIFATDGLSAETIYGHLAEFYRTHSEIPNSRKPNLIHVAGKYLIQKAPSGCILDGKTPLKKDEYVILAGSPDAQAMSMVVKETQIRATLSNYIVWDYQTLYNNLAATFIPSGK